jgi:hypothetical protein
VKAEAHVWVIELRHIDGNWRPLGLNFHISNSAANYWLAVERKERQTDELRIRKYVRQPPCGSEGK